MDVGGILYSKQIEAFMETLEGKQETNLESSVYVQKAIKDIYASVELAKKVPVGKEV